jgi:5-methyltetrahydropteroyltriglutamate--homocysteine methyltransferase
VIMTRLRFKIRGEITTCLVVFPIESFSHGVRLFYKVRVNQQTEDEQFMAAYGKYTTTVIGSYSVPRWYETLEKQVEAGNLAKGDMEDAQYRATQAAILDQETAGIDIITGGEMHRRTNNRHAPPNAMLNFFWEKIPGFSRETRPKPITVKDPSVFHPAAICTGPIDYGDLGLVDEFQMVSEFAKKEVKITMTGPHMLAKVAWDEHYGDMGKMMQDLAKVMNRNFKELEKAGCKYIQIDEPLFAISDAPEVEEAVEAINLSTEGLKNVSVQVHICQGNYAVGPEYDGQIGHRYFDTGRYPAELICKINCDALLIEHDQTPKYEGLLGNKYLAVGAVDVQDFNVESAETIGERLTKYSWLSPEQTLITSSCGMNHLPRHIAFGKLKAMAAAKKLLGA